MTDLTAQDVIDYLVGVYRILTGDDLGKVVVHQVPAIAPDLNKIITILSPIVAYDLTKPKRPTP